VGEFAYVLSVLSSSNSSVVYEYTVYCLANEITAEERLLQYSHLCWCLCICSLSYFGRGCLVLRLFPTRKTTCPRDVNDYIKPRDPWMNPF